MSEKYDNKWRTAVILSTLRQYMKDAHPEVKIEEIFPHACKVVDDMRESYLKSDQKRLEESK